MYIIYLFIYINRHNPHKSLQRDCRSSSKIHENSIFKRLFHKNKLSEIKMFYAKLFSV